MEFFKVLDQRHDLSPLLKHFLSLSATTINEPLRHEIKQIGQ